MSYVYENKIMTPKQFGFVKNRSTSDCITKLVHSLLNNVNNNLITGCVFLDYSKAFDSVAHSTLLQKLECYGCTSIPWFSSYLNQRWQCVKIGGVVSEVRTIMCGVPQGSVLRPTLFNLYVNDIATLPLHSNMLLYADDIVIYLSGRTFNEIFANMQADLNLINEWSVVNKLSLSPSKSKALLIGRKNTLEKLHTNNQFRLGMYEMEWVDHFTYLGVIIDRYLTFNLTIDQMHRKAAHRLKNFVSIRKNLTLHSALVFAKSLILPYVDYGLFLLSGCQEAHLKKLQSLQNRILKAALGVNRLFNTRNLHHQSNILLIKDRILWQQLKVIHRSILLNINIFPHKLVLAPTRASDSVQLDLQTPKIELYRKSICYNGIREYNLLSDDLKNSSLHSFGIKLKKIDSKWLRYCLMICGTCYYC